MRSFTNLSTNRGLDRRRPLHRPSRALFPTPVPQRSTFGHRECLAYAARIVHSARRRIGADPRQLASERLHLGRLPPLCAYHLASTGTPEFHRPMVNTATPTATTTCTTERVGITCTRGSSRPPSRSPGHRHGSRAGLGDHRHERLFRTATVAQEPLREVGALTEFRDGSSIVPARVSHRRSRYPLREFTRSSVRSPYSAPHRVDASADINVSANAFNISASRSLSPSGSSRRLRARQQDQ